MLAKHDPWLNFGLWVVLVGLLNFSVICGSVLANWAWWINTFAILLTLFCSILILIVFCLGVKQQSCRKKGNGVGMKESGRVCVVCWQIERV